MKENENFLDKNRITIIIVLILVIISSWVYLFLSDKNQVNADSEHKIKILEAKVNDLHNSKTQMVVVEEDIKTNYEQEPQENIEKINLNTADQVTLESLTGIGPTKAADIISYRESNEGFKTTAEIQNVKGIGPATYDKILEQIFVE